MAKFEDSIQHVLDNEGGYVDDPTDSGGETNFGISKRSYPNVDIKNLTVEGAKAIYLRDFWKFSGILNQAVATKLFDASVNMGRQAVKIMQRQVNAVVDGAYGPATEKLINLEEPSLLLSRYRIALAQFYIELARRKPEQAKFLKGWLRRARQ